jgi:hypothetical protein
VKAPKDGPLREALARISPKPSVQNAAYRLYTERPELLKIGVLQALDLASRQGDA